MAIDQTPSPTSSDSGAAPAIENEFPTYRAISSLAVFSLVLGLAAVFSFASLWFLLLTAGSTLFGWLALRKIQRLPEILTGSSIARVGIGVGLLFGLSALTYSVTEDWVTTKEASDFSKQYIQIIKDQPVSLALWYEQDPEYRKIKSADEAAEEIKNQKSPTMPDPFGERAGPFMRIKNRLKSPEQDLKFSKIETKLIHGLTIYANALLELDGPITKEFPKKEYILILMIKGPGGTIKDWVVKDIKYPYTPESAGVEVPHSDDDGHGH